MERAGKTLQLNASIPKDLMKQLKELAKKEDRSLSNLVSVLLKKAISMELENAIKSREKLQNKAEDFLNQLNVEERRKLPSIFWELFGDKYKP